ncbi:head GIN domain-containing protein [uncultured Maribacter sp.]|uniref:head GIN domain-containing protein n=1 Tax=uncultured Maribacter sp. TaxID=431308 RepID=UPI0026083D08|nr:head GIN domain-containing protein [uncultured Maribacter sp.]
MKKGNCIFVLVLILNFACTSSSAPDCFQAAGIIGKEEIIVSEFNKITVFENIELILKQGEQKVEIETGEFLKEEVFAVVEDGRLVLRDENNCNFVRDYGVTKIYVTAPNITEIRSSTSWPIRNEGELSFSNLVLLSESYGEPKADTTDGEFILKVNTNNLSVVVNGNSFFKLSGATENLNVTIASGDSRMEMENLIAKNVMFNHRGSNDFLVYPVEALSGILRGTGDVRSFNEPTNVSVETLYTGSLIFED